MLRSLSALLLLSTAAMADTADGEALKAMSWDQIVKEARGGTVNWFMWGGADTINAYVSDYVAGRLKAEYDITLNRVPITDAAEIVNLILSEKEAGVTDAGTVDLIWINGENFRSMKQGDLAFCGYTDLLPNDALVN
ncbi:MAG: ABC transporter substrate-binding protein, partial [Tabrizicola sp.]